MTRNRKHNIFGWLAVLALLLTTACSENTDLYQPKKLSGTRRTVTLNVQLESQSKGTRAGTEMPHISDGTKVDRLIYAVYSKSRSGNSATGAVDANKKVTADGYSLDELNMPTYTEEEQAGLGLGDGQHYIKWDPDNQPVKVEFDIDDEMDYKVAFWAQSSKTDAFETKDLTDVKVNYTKEVNGQTENCLNNDELRDAFCAHISFTDEDVYDGPVYLRRPFAQINVGTAGWDYEGEANEGLIEGIEDAKAVLYTQSQIKLSDVAQYYNVLDGKALLDEAHKTTNVTFDYHRLPAFINKDGEQDFKPSVDVITDEEFLTVDLNKDHKIADYVSWEDFQAYQKDEDTKDENGEMIKKGGKTLYNEGVLPETETFKYLSMCYALVPEAKKGTNSAGVENSAVLSSVAFSLKDQNSENEKLFTINNVPVKKNWRTNILSTNLFTVTNNYKIDIVPEYCGDYNNDETTTGSWPRQGEYWYWIQFGSSENNTTNGRNDDKSGNFFTISRNPNASSSSSIGYGSKSKYGEGTYVSSIQNKTLSFNDGGLKLNAASRVTFTTDYVATVIVVHSVKTQEKGDDVDCQKGIRFDGKDYPLSKAIKNPKGCSGVYVHTITEVPAGEHHLERDETEGTLYETGLYYIEVINSYTAESTIYPNDDFKSPEDDDDYYSKSSDQSKSE